MTDTSGLSSLMPFARYDPISSSSKTWTDTGLLGLPMSLPTLPPWGWMRGGELFERPTPARLTAARAYSSLPTPKAADGTRGRDVARRRPDEHSRELATTLAFLPTPLADMGRMQREDFRPNLRTIIEGNAMLPTPTASDSNGTGRHGDGGMDLRTTISLLPTPTVIDMGGGRTPQEWADWTARMKTTHSNGNGHGRSLFQECLGASTNPPSDAGSTS